MSYDIYLREPNSNDTIEFDSNHDAKGGTYAIGGTREAWLNVTYNYSEHFYRTIDAERGIRFLYGKKAEDTIPILEKAIGELKGDTDPDYWKPTEGNARNALLNLLGFARIRPDGIWGGD